MERAKPRVGLFLTCLVDFFRPSVGRAARRLLERAGADVVTPPGAVCCGQPAYNSGDRKTAQALAERVIAALAPFDQVVVPSGSCAGMLRVHYPKLFPGRKDAAALAAKTRELSEYLAQQPGFVPPGKRAAAVAYHDSCSSLRELGVAAAPRALLRNAGVAVRELNAAQACCGFGGTFCVKYPEISARMAAEKCAAVTESGAKLLVGADLGCLLHLAGTLKRQGAPIEVRHLAEVLDDKTTGAAIGEGAP